MYLTAWKAWPKSNWSVPGLGYEQVHTERVATFLGAAAGVRTILNSAIIPVRAPVRERADLQAQLLLDIPAYEQAYATGHNMTLEDAISFGLDVLPLKFHRKVLKPCPFSSALYKTRSVTNRIGEPVHV